MRVSLNDDLKKLIYDAGVEATFNGQSIKVLFNEAGDIWDTKGGLIEYDSPNAVCYPDDVATAQNGDIININGQDYYIASIKRSANGETVLTLSEVELNG